MSVYLELGGDLLYIIAKFNVLFITVYSDSHAQLR